MIQVLGRAVDILETLASSPQRPQSAGMVAQATGLPVSTCVRILKTLACRGLVQQAGPRQGYTLGGSLYAMVSGSPYRPDLIRAAEGPAHHLAQKVREAVVVNVLQQGRLLRVLGVEAEQAVQVSAAVVESGDPYTRCTGRILLAHQSPEQLELHVQRAGLPGRRWPPVTRMEDLRRRLAAVRKMRMLQEIVGDIAALACPILQDDRAVAAIGVYLPAQRFVGKVRQRIVKSLARAASEISGNLSHHPSAV